MRDKFFNHALITF